MNMGVLKEANREEKYLFIIIIVGAFFVDSWKKLAMFYKQLS